MPDLQNIKAFKIENSKPFRLTYTIDMVLDALKPTRFNFVSIKQTEYESKKDFVRFKEVNNRTNVILVFRWGRLYGLTCTELCLEDASKEKALPITFIIDDNKREYKNVSKDIYIGYGDLKEILDKSYYTEDIINIKLDKAPDFIGLKSINMNDVDCYIVYHYRTNDNIKKLSFNFYTKGLLETGVVEIDFEQSSDINKALIEEVLAK